MHVRSSWTAAASFGAVPDVPPENDQELASLYYNRAGRLPGSSPRATVCAPSKSPGRPVQCSSDRQCAPTHCWVRILDPQAGVVKHAMPRIAAQACPVRRQLGSRRLTHLLQSQRRTTCAGLTMTKSPAPPSMAATRWIWQLSFLRAFRRRFGRRRRKSARSWRSSSSYSAQICPSPCSSPSQRVRGRGSPRPRRGQPG